MGPNFTAKCPTLQQKKKIYTLVQKVVFGLYSVANFPLHDT